MTAHSPPLATFVQAPQHGSRVVVPQPSADPQPHEQREKHQGLLEAINPLPA